MTPVVKHFKVWEEKAPVTTAFNLMSGSRESACVFSDQPVLVMWVDIPEPPSPAPASITFTVYLSIICPPGVSPLKSVQWLALVTSGRVAAVPVSWPDWTSDLLPSSSNNLTQLTLCLNAMIHAHLVGRRLKGALATIPFSSTSFYRGSYESAESAAQEKAERKAARAAFRAGVANIAAIRANVLEAKSEAEANTERRRVAQHVARLTAGFILDGRDPDDFKSVHRADELALYQASTSSARASISCARAAAIAAAANKAASRVNAYPQLSIEGWYRRYDAQRRAAYRKWRQANGALDEARVRYRTSQRMQDWATLFWRSEIAGEYRDEAIEAVALCCMARGKLYLHHGHQGEKDYWAPHMSPRFDWNLKACKHRVCLYIEEQMRAAHTTYTSKPPHHQL
jgi:hypothetical protein